MYVWFSCKAINLSTKTKLEFLNQIHRYYLATSPKGVLPYENVGGAFVGMAWTLFTPLRDTISVSNNRINFSGITILK